MIKSSIILNMNIYIIQKKYAFLFHIWYVDIIYVFFVRSFFQISGFRLVSPRLPANCLTRSTSWAVGHQKSEWEHLHTAWWMWPMYSCTIKKENTITNKGTKYYKKWSSYFCLWMFFLWFWHSGDNFSRSVAVHLLLTLSGSKW